MEITIHTLKQLKKLLYPFTSTDLLRNNMQCIAYRCDKKQFWATDAHRARWIDAPYNQAADFDFVINRKVLTQLISAKHQSYEIGITAGVEKRDEKSEIVFEFSSGEFSISNPREVKMPNVDLVIPEIVNHEFSVDLDADKIKGLVLVGNSTTKQIIFQFDETGKELSILSSCIDFKCTAQYNNTPDVEKGCEGLRFALNGRMLGEYLATNAEPGGWLTFKLDRTGDMLNGVRINKDYLQMPIHLF